YSTAPSFTGYLLDVQKGAELKLYDITVDGHNKAVSGSSTVTAEGISAQSAMIKVGGTVEMNKAQLINNSNPGTGTGGGFGGAVNILGGGSLTVLGGSGFEGNSANKGQAINLNPNGSLTMGGSLSFGADQYVYFNTSNNNDNAYIRVNDNISGTVPVDMPEELVKHGKIIASYDAGYESDAEAFTLCGELQDLADALDIVKTARGQDVCLLQSFEVSYELSNGLSAAKDPDRAGRDAEYKGKLSVSGNYSLPKDLTKVEVFRLNGYTKNESGKFEAVFATEATVLTLGRHYELGSDGTIRIFAENVQGNIKITAAGLPVYSVDYQIDGMKHHGDYPVKLNENDGLTAYFHCDEGYEILDKDSAVSVTLNGVTLNRTVSYSDGEMIVEVAPNQINGVENIDERIVVVSITPTLKNYGVYEDIDGVFIENDSEKELTVQHGAALNVTLKIENADGYELPKTITVSSGGRELENDEFTYERSTGKVTINSGVIKGDVVISGEPVTKEFDLVFDLEPEDILAKAVDAPEKVKYGSELNTSLRIIPTDGSYSVPEMVEIRLYKGETNEYTTADVSSIEGYDIWYNGETGELHIAKGNIEGKVEIIGKARQNYNVSVSYSTKDDYTENPVSFTGKSGGFVQPEKTEYSGLFSVTKGFEIKEITVTIKGSEHTGFSLEDNIFSIPGEAVTGDIVINVEHQRMRFGGSADVDNTDREDESGSVVVIPEAVYGQAYELEITPDKGYELSKDDITVTIGGTEYTGFTYTEGTLSIPNSAVTGEIEISGAARIKTYKLTATLDVQLSSNPKIAPDGNVIEHFSTPEVTISAAQGYNVPASVEVKMDGTPLTAGTDYSYTPSGEGNLNNTAVIKLIKQVSGDVHIKASAQIESYKVTYAGKLDAFDADTNPGTINYNQTLTAKFTLKDGYKNPTYMVNGTINSWDGKTAIRVENVNSDVTITLGAEEIFHNVTATLNNVAASAAIPAAVKYGSSLSIDLNEVDNYNLPSSVTVNGASFTYNSGTGVITISNITADVSITANGVAEQHRLTANVGSLLTYTGNTGENAVTYGTDYTATISVADDVKGTVDKPGSISVKIGSGNAQPIQSSDNTTGIRYNKDTGTIVIPGNELTGDVIISAAGVQSFSVTVTVDHVTETLPETVRGSEGVATENVS
ncbi:MAG: hypothetical protein IJ364_05860, partial [Oscillospiraceae bacterium]|nr:hypothetical protein [Oscillospiraceae bacterium]